MESPAILPVVHAAWKLNPPVTPSISSASPAKNRFWTCLLCMSLKLISLRLTPPQVTNSSLLVLLPSTERMHAVRFRAIFSRSDLES